MASDDIGELLEVHGAGLPVATDGSGSFRFSAAFAPDLPTSLRTDALVVTKSFCVYNGCWRADCLDVFASKGTLRGLSLVVLAALFLPADSTVEIELTHPASEVRLLRVCAPTGERDLVTRPESFEYWPTTRPRHPWDDQQPDPSDLPSFQLTSADETGGVSEDDWRHRDTIVGFGNALATARLGSLLLDLGVPASRTDEVHLEGENGVRGVGLLSAEVRLWLPGSLGWRTEYGLSDASPT